jgi:hypothetical protein
MPHRVIVLDRLRMPPATGHLTGETRKGGDAINTLFDQMPEDTVMCLTLVARRRTSGSPSEPPGEKAVGETWRRSRRSGRAAGARLIGSAHKLYRARWRSTCAAATWPSSICAACSSAT